jgi:hypothetical protein
MAEPQFRRDTEDGKGKYYDHPLRTDENGQSMRYDSVTTALGVKEKSSLKFWAAKLAARRASENLPKLLRAARIDPCGRTWNRTGPERCDQCVTCTQRWVELFHVGESERRRREGSATHDFIEHWSYHGELPKDLAPDQEPYAKSFLLWVADYGITPDSFLARELTVYNHTHLYAGTLDMVLRIEPITAKAARFCARLGKPDEAVKVIGDNKSREGEDKQLYEEQPLQVTAYRRGETMLPKGSAVEFAMPPTDGAAILQPRPDGYTFEPVLSDEPEFQAFLHALGLYRWSQARGALSIQVQAFKAPDGWKYQPPKPTVPEAVTDLGGRPRTSLPAAGPETRAELKGDPPPRKRAPRKAAGTARPRSVKESVLGSASTDAIGRSGRPAAWGDPDKPIPF